MTHLPSFGELPRILLAVLFIAITIIASLWILHIVERFQCSQAMPLKQDCTARASSV